MGVTRRGKNKMAKKGENDASFDRSLISNTQPSQGEVQVFGKPWGGVKTGGIKSVDDQGGTVAERRNWASGAMESQPEGPIQRQNVNEWVEKARNKNRSSEAEYS